jgi:hypothetical protein
MIAEKVGMSEWSRLYFAPFPENPFSSNAADYSKERCDQNNEGSEGSQDGLFAST